MTLTEHGEGGHHDMALKINSKDLAAMGVFTAFVAAATMAVSIFVAATGGYFNVGETMVYTTALLMGPIVGGFAGGVGSMLADVALGYGVFAPATLVIKGLEGFIVGYLARYRLRPSSKMSLTSLSLAAGAILAFTIWWGGTSNFTGSLEFTLGVAPNTITLAFIIPDFFWVALAIASFILVAAVGLYLDPQVGWVVLAVILGGGEMILGYYIYESLIFGPVVALAEILVNVGQVTIGLLVAIPLSRSIRRIMPRARRLQAESVEAK